MLTASLIQVSLVFHERPLSGPGSRPGSRPHCVEPSRLRPPCGLRQLPRLRRWTDELFPVGSRVLLQRPLPP